MRKNHLTGKNHAKLVCDYYEGMFMDLSLCDAVLTGTEKAKELGIWSENEMPFEMTRDKLYRGIPGSDNKAVLDLYRLADMRQLPPPPTISGMPGPPPRVLHDTKEKEELVGNILNTIS